LRPPRLLPCSGRAAEAPLRSLGRDLAGKALRTLRGEVAVTLTLSCPILVETAVVERHFRCRQIEPGVGSLQLMQRAGIAAERIFVQSENRSIREMAARPPLKDFPRLRLLVSFPQLARFELFFPQRAEYNSAFKKK
jgi:hypothetical protein